MEKKKSNDRVVQVEFTLGELREFMREVRIVIGINTNLINRLNCVNSKVEKDNPSLYPEEYSVELLEEYCAGDVEWLEYLLKIRETNLRLKKNKV